MGNLASFEEESKPLRPGAVFGPWTEQEQAERDRLVAGAIAAGNAGDRTQMLELQAQLQSLIARIHERQGIDPSRLGEAIDPTTAKRVECATARQDVAFRIGVVAYYTKVAAEHRRLRQQCFRVRVSPQQQELFRDARQRLQAARSGIFRIGSRPVVVATRPPSRRACRRTPRRRSPSRSRSPARGSDSDSSRAPSPPSSSRSGP